MTTDENPPLPMVCTWTGFQHQPISCIAFNPSADLLASASHDGLIVIVSTNTGRPAVILQFDAMIIPTSVHWINKLRFWVSTSDGMVTLWEFVQADANELVLLEVLPFYFPEAPSFVRGDWRGATRKELSQHLVVAFGRTFEHWGNDFPENSKSGGCWSGLGRTTTIDSEDTALAAWPLSKHKIIVVFGWSGARLWSPCDDALQEIIGWPSGRIHAAHMINPPKEEVPKAAHQYFSAQADHDSGKVVLLLDNRLLVVSLTCNQSAAFARIQHTIGLGNCIQPIVSSVTCWGGIPIFFTPVAAGLGAFNISGAAIQQAAASNTTVLLDSLLSQTLKPSGCVEGFTISHAAGVSGKEGCHVASVVETSGGPSISLWSVGHEGVNHQIVSPFTFDPPRLIRVHEQLREFLQRQKNRPLRAAKSWRSHIAAVEYFAVIPVAPEVGVGFVELHQQLANDLALPPIANTKIPILFTAAIVAFVDLTCSGPEHPGGLVVSEKSTTEHIGDTFKGKSDNLASSFQPQGEKSSSQKAGDALSGNSTNDSMMDKAKHALGMEKD
ncbi:hypothetical protein BKA62DRAFT_782296 [Auriculariales sp. MPI-PUGE-AT-0066]|nr:hypothetical protein BKA62DRAFT_782296 [Auriculariales sp. MPI-PUGE-AT-0066]